MNFITEISLAYPGALRSYGGFIANVKHVKKIGNAPKL